MLKIRHYLFIKYTKINWQSQIKNYNNKVIYLRNKVIIFKLYSSWFNNISSVGNIIYNFYKN